MRKLIYSEILMMYHIATTLPEEKPVHESLHTLYSNQEHFLKDNFKFRAEEYYLKDLDTFAALDERFYVEALYRKYHAALDDVNNRYANLSVASAMTAEFFVEKNLRQSWLKKTLNNNARATLQRMEHLNNQRLLKLKELEGSSPSKTKDHNIAP
jgi:hypothetical protein